MSSSNPQRVFAIFWLGLFVIAVTPICAVFLAFGWSWRLWVASVSRTMHIALREPTQSLVHR